MTDIDPARVKRITARVCRAMTSEFIYGVDDWVRVNTEQELLALARAAAVVISNNRRARRFFLDALRSEINRPALDVLNTSSGVIQ